MHDATGQTIDDYHILERIGSGGMGTVYRAVQLSLQREVAIKVLPDELANNPQYLGRFAREARALTQLEHPHIVPVYGYGTDGKTSYLVMRLLTGGTLADYLAQRGRVPLDDARRIFDHISAALHYAHAQGIIHRDIKASNIIFDSQFNAYLTDFGIAKLVHTNEQLTATGMILGTPSYMAPELWKGQAATAHSDIYSLGVVLYAMLTGKPPFEAATPYALMEKHVSEPPRPPSSISPGLSPAIDAVTVRALAKSPLDRYPDPASMARALADASWNLTPRLGTLTATELAISEPVRRPRVWRTGLLVSGVLVLLIGMVVLLAVLLPRAERETHTPAPTANETQLAAAVQATVNAITVATPTPTPPMRRPLPLRPACHRPPCPPAPPPSRLHPLRWRS